MKILFIIDTLRRGGKEKQLTELINQLYNEHQIYLICFSDVIEYEKLKELPIIIKILNHKKKSITSTSNIFKICKEFTPDVIHTWDVVSSLLAIPASKLLHIKLVNSSLRGSAKRSLLSRYKLLANFTFLFSNKVIANSAAGLKSLNKKENKKFIVIKNGFNFNQSKDILREKGIRNQYNIKTHFIIGMVSNFREGKDYDTFFNTAVKILNLRKDITFIAIGDGPDYNFYWNKYKNYKNIIFTGKLYDTVSLIKLFTIGVLLSVTCNKHGEGISNSIMEYLAHSKPVITTNSGGNTEIINHKVNGIIIPQKDIESFEKYIIILLSNASLRKTLGEQGKFILYKNFSFSIIKDQYLKIYNELVCKN